MSYHLVTTSEIKTRSLDKQNLFLGSWCVPYSEIISKNLKDYLFVKPLLINKENLDKDQNKILNFTKRLIEKVIPILNKHHNENFDERQWTILLGIWIHKYVSMIINRYSILESALKNYDISSSTFYFSKDYEINCKDTYNFSEICNDSLWNNVIYYKILSYIDHRFEKKILNINKKKNITVKKKSIKNYIKKISNFFFKNQLINSNSFILNTYLNKSDELKLLFLFKQPPIFLEDNFDYNSTDFLLRSKLKKILLPEQKKDLESAIMGTFFDVFPNIYLESFLKLKKNLKKFPLPKNPQFIFTSNNFETNETFKIYCVNKIKYSKYIIGQHGATYGSGRYQISQIYNLKVADKLITWGWNEHSKTKKGFLFRKLNANKNRGTNIALMIRLMMPNLRTHDMYEELEKEFEDDYKLVKGFKKEIKDNLEIKLHPGDGKFYNFETRSRWLNEFRDIKLNETKISFDKYKNNKKLIIFNHESTGFLQLININYPTLLVLRNFDFQIDDQYKKYYKYLINSKILHLNNESLTSHLNEVWPNLDQWWNSNNTQINLKKFVEKFANNKDSSPKDLQKILLGI